MLVEFVGPSSSGKTHFISFIIRALRSVSYDPLLVQDCHLNRIIPLSSTGTYHSLLIDLKLLPNIFFVMRKYRKLITIVSSVALQRNDSVFMRINLIRNFIKKLALFEFAQGDRNKYRVLFFDEGTVQSFLNIFVHYDDEPDVDTMLDLLPELPLPDIIIHFTIPEHVIITRAKNRSDPPWKFLSDSQWRNLTRNFDKAYRLVYAKRIHDIMTMDVTTSHKSDTDRDVKRVVNFLAKALNRCKKELEYGSGII